MKNNNEASREELIRHIEVLTKKNEALEEFIDKKYTKASNLVFPKELIARVKKNWLTTSRYLTIGKTDNELLIEFVKLSRAIDAETGLADEISFLVIDQTII